MPAGLVLRLYFELAPRRPKRTEQCRTAASKNDSKWQIPGESGRGSIGPGHTAGWTQFPATGTATSP